MTALRKILVFEEEPVVAAKAAQAPAVKLHLVAGGAPAEVLAEQPEAAGGGLKDIALFFAAPFIGLAYFVALPVVGLVVLAVMAARAAARTGALKAIAVALRTPLMFVAAPFIGLAFAIVFPFVGLAMLAWVGGRAAVGAARLG